MRINISDFDFDALYAAMKQARASRLTLCIATNGGWANEPSKTWIPNQFMRITENFSREGLEREIRENIAAINTESY